MVDLDIIDVYFTTSKICSNPPNISRYYPNGPCFPLGVFSTTPKKLIVLCGAYIPILFDIYLCPPYYSTGESNEYNNKLEELGMLALKPINVLMITGEI